MLSIGAMGSGQGTYYVGLAREDYYLEGGEPPGQWVGEGAHAMGLTGQVEREAFLNLFAGADASGAPLVQNAGDPKRQPGWDLTFSAPKSVSTLWAVADEETRRAIQEAHFQAVQSALKTVEENATTRRGKGGDIKEAAKLVIATFEHGTSRAQDPQLHTHALVLNIGVREDGTTGALESQNLYRSKMVVGALYRAEFAKQLREMGFEIERDGKSFAVRGVSGELQKEFSKRRAEIESRLDANGKSSARAAAFAALDTRSVKEHIARDELFASWRAVGKGHDFTPQEAQNLKTFAPTRGPQIEMQEALSLAVAKISRDKSHFGERDLVRAVAEEAQGRALGADQVRGAVRAELEKPHYMALGQHKGEVRYTTQALWETEKALLKDAATLQQNVAHQVEHRHLLRGMLEVERCAAQKANGSEEAPRLSDEQRHALRHITEESGALALVSGMAGTGKTFMLEAARETWEAQGFKVIGAAVAGKAANGLEEGAGIKSSTLVRFLWEQERGFELVPSEKFARKVEWLHATWQIDGKMRHELLSPLEAPHSKGAVEWQYATWQISKSKKELLEKQIERREKYQLDEKTVLVVDEAGMVGTHQMAKLLAAAQEAGAKVVLVGDARQLQSVDIGGPFAALQNRLGAAELSGIIRQKELWARQAVQDFAEGKAERALWAYEGRGLLSIAPNREGAKDALIETWKAEGVKAPGENVIFAGTRAEARDLNQRAQEERQRAGVLGFRALRVGEAKIHEKDRVLFTRNNTKLGVKNGTTGTVKEVDKDRQTLLVRLDSGEETLVPCREYGYLTLGYALTTHKGQGMTTKNAFILTGGVMADREIAYVQASRARETTRLFTEKIEEWNPLTRQKEDATVRALGNRLSQSRQKDLAHDVGGDIGQDARAEIRGFRVPQATPYPTPSYDHDLSLSL